MISLVPTAPDESAIYDDVSASRRSATATILIGVRRRVFSAYDDYEVAKEAPSGHASVARSDDERRALRSNYERLNQGFRHIRRDVMKRSTRCCLCGDANAGTLDHHLPREVWPEYSIYTYNLVPCCSRCNGVKRSKHSRADGGPLFLHAYLDSLPTSPMLAVTVEATSGFAVRYEVICPPGMAPDIFQTAQSHFDVLGLALLYRQAAIMHINEHMVAYREYLKDPRGSGAVSDYLDRDARSAQARLGVNHWRVVLLHGLAANADFCSGGFEFVTA